MKRLILALAALSVLVVLPPLVRPASAQVVCYYQERILHCCSTNPPEDGWSYGHC